MFNLIAFAIALNLSMITPISAAPSDVKRKIASNDGYTPQAAIEDALSAPLIFKGRGILPGADTTGSCVFSNDKVYVVYHYCLKSKKEAEALNIDIISFEGGVVNFAYENSNDKKIGSSLRRSQYDRAWRISFFKTTGEIKKNMNLMEMKTFLTATTQMMNSKGSCFAGGMMKATPDPACKGTAAELTESWGPSAGDFWTEPDESWYTFQKKMRSEIASQLTIAK